MGNVPVQVISSLIENHNDNPAPTGVARVPDWLKETTLEKEKSSEDIAENPNTEKVDSIFGGQSETITQKDETDTLIPNPKPPVRVVNEMFQEINPVKTIALDTPDELTRTAQEEQRELITGIAHGRVK
jgi:hypothetical protein